jgi:hypothetical protein
MIRTLIITATILAGTAAGSIAQPPYPFPQPPRYPQYPPRPQLPNPGASPVDGIWYFRGDPNQPTSIQTVQTPFGPEIIVTNEKGSPSPASLSADGRRLSVYDWNITGRVRGSRIIWPNGDFWGR